MSDYNKLREQLISTVLTSPAEKVKDPSNSLSFFWQQNNHRPLWDQPKAASIKIGLDYLAHNPNNFDPLVIYGLLADSSLFNNAYLNKTNPGTDNFSWSSEEELIHAVQFLEVLQLK